LQSLSEDAQGDKDLVRELAESYYRLGDIERSLGQTQAALLDYERSLALIESVGDDRAGSPAQRLQFLKTSSQLAALEGQRGQLSSAMKRSKEAVDASRGWISEAGPLPEARQALFTALAVRGGNLEQSGDETGARRDLEEARTVALPLMHNDPQNDDLAFLTARPIYALADLCNALKDGSAGYRYGKEAREILDRLVRDHPENRLWRRIRIMAISAVAGGADLLAQQQPAFRQEAVGHAKEAYEDAKAGALRDPDDNNELDDYIVMAQRFAIHLDHAARAAEAIPLTNEAQLEILHLIQRDPKDARNRYLRADNRLLTGEMFCDLHRWKDADQALTEAEMYVEDALKISPDDGVVLEDKIALFNDQVTVARNRKDLAHARERCSAGLHLASQLIRQDPAMASYLTSLPDLQKQAKELGIPDTTARLSVRAN
jgi:tetratricopeptide (TPR) repeat protein